MVYIQKWISISFLAISDQYATFFIYFSQNGCRRPFWMTENHFWSHFSPCQINTQLFVLIFFHKMADGSHFGWPRITFDRISPHFRSIHNFYFFHKMAAGGHFGWPKIAFDHISRHFRSIRNFDFFLNHKMAAGDPFGWPKITFESISRHFRSIRNKGFKARFTTVTICCSRLSQVCFHCHEPAIQHKIEVKLCIPSTTPGSSGEKKRKKKNCSTSLIGAFGEHTGMTKVMLIMRLSIDHRLDVTTSRLVNTSRLIHTTSRLLNTNHFLDNSTANQLLAG